MVGALEVTKDEEMQRMFDLIKHVGTEYSILVEKLAAVNISLASIKTEQATLIKQVDEIFKRLNGEKLPCDVHLEKITALEDEEKLPCKTHRNEIASLKSSNKLRMGIDISILLLLIGSLIRTFMVK